MDTEENFGITLNSFKIKCPRLDYFKLRVITTGTDFQNMFLV